MSTIFGGNTGLTYEQAQRKRALAEALLGNSIASAPQNMGEGWTALGQAFAGRMAGKKADKADAAGKAEATGLWDSIWGDHLAGKAGGAQPGSGMGGAVSAGGGASVDPLDPRNIAGDTMAAIGKDGGTAGYRESLIGTESGGNWGARNNEMGAGGQAGHFGRVQFGKARLQDAMNAGAIPQGTTPEQFMASPALQVAAENWHFGDLENRLGDLVGTTINGQPLDMGALVAMGHLGGAGGARKFVESGGAYNPSDSFGTSLAEYAQTHGGQGGSPAPAGGQVTMSAAGGDPAAAMPGQPGLQDVGKMLEALSNPYLPEAQKGVLAQLVEQALAPPPVADPMKALELEKAQLEVDAMRNPGQKIPPEAQERLYLMQQAGLDPNTPEGQQYLLTGKMPGLPGDGTEYGLQPVYGKDKDGNVVVLQIGKDGTAVQTKLPEGISPDLAVKAYETAQGTAEGKAAGEGVADLDVALSTMPGLEQTVSEMSELAGQASYTLPGQAYNAVAEKVFGAEPTQGSVAASKYQAMLDNVIMPVLKQTLGSQFTEADRVALSKSLGDPSASPAAKQATLEAFIRQKRLDVDAMTRLSGGDGGGVPTIDVNDDAAYDALPSGTEFMGSDGKKYRKP